jgi:hypothetical protein
MGNNAFWNAKALTTVTMPKNLEDSGTNIFSFSTTKNNVLTTVIYPEGTKFSGNGSFRNCTALVNVTIPSSMEKIGTYCFAGCTSLVTLSEESSLAGLKEVGDGAFFECDALESINLTRACTTIGGGAFQKCPALTSIGTIRNITSIGAGAFYGDTLLASDTSSNGLMDFMNLQELGAVAFYECTSLRTVSLGDVVDIPQAAFYGCTALEQVLSYQKSILTVDNYGFYGCENLSLIPLDGLTSVGNAGFFGCAKLGDYTFKALTYIGDSAFYGCEAITQMVLGADVEYIGSAAFSGCTSLKKLVVDEANETYFTENNVLFRNVPNGIVLMIYLPQTEATTYSVPEGVVYIDAYAFAYNNYLRSVELPTTLKSLGTGAFYGCEHLSYYRFNSYEAPRLETTPVSTTSNYYSLPYNNFTYYLAYLAYAEENAAGFNLVLAIPTNAHAYDGMVWDNAFTIRLATKEYIEEKTENVISEIDALPTTISVSDKELLELVKAHYDALTDAQKAFVDNASKLTASIADYDQIYSNIYYIIAQVKAMRSKILTKDDKELIDALYVLYNALDEAGQEMVKNNKDDVILEEDEDIEDVDGYDYISELDTYRKKVRDLTMPTTATLKVINGISALGTVSFKDADTIADLIKRYGQLKDTQKELVTNYDLLLAAQSRLDDLRAEAEAFDALLAALPATATTAEEASNVALLYAAYNDYDDDFKAQLTNSQTLLTAYEGLGNSLSATKTAEGTSTTSNTAIIAVAIVAVVVAVLALGVAVTLTVFVLKKAKKAQ